MKLTRYGLFFLALLLTPCLARAQNGCLDSPESPTLVLLLVGGVGVCFKGFRRPRQ